MRRLVFSLAYVCLGGFAVNAMAETEDIAPHRITVVMTPGITSWLQLPSEDLVQTRRDLAQGRFVSTTQLRRLADLGDGFAALRFAQRLEESGANNPADIAHYYGMAAATGRGGAIVNMIRHLDQIDPADVGPRRLGLLRGIVVAYANAGNSAAAEALIRYHWRQVPFGPLYDEVEAVLARLDGELGAELSLRHAVAILQDRQRTKQDLLNVQTYLAAASQATSLETRLVAQNLEPVLEAALTEYAPLNSEDPQ